MRRTPLIGLPVALALAAVVAGCSSGTASPSAPPSPSGTAPAAVDVKLQEWAVVPAPASVPAGSVAFTVKNSGPNDVHEMVVVKTDLDPGALPAQADGSIDEAGAGVTAIGEVEDVEVGGTKTLTVDLAPGKYVLLCNIVDGDEVHYKLGMRAAFTVTP
jgi:uncharacterized cupredoxin-like copper-binding protein